MAEKFSEEDKVSQNNEGVSKAEIELRRLYAHHSTADERYATLRHKLAPFFSAGHLTDEHERALRIASAGNADEFVKAVLSLIEPLLRLKIDEPEKFREIVKEHQVRESNYKTINELFYYEIHNEGQLRLHVADLRGTKPGELIVLLRQGMRKLARIVHANPEIKEVVAASWIVASGGSMLKKLGFELDGPIDEEVRRQHFSEETRPIHGAHIKREDLIKKWHKSGD